MDTPSVRPEVLGRLLATPSLLEVLPDIGAIALFLEAALQEVPGFHTLMICTEESIYTHHRDAREGTVPRVVLPDFYSSGSLPTGRFLQSEAEALARYFIALATAHHQYGYLILEIDDPEQFAPYAPYIHNLANMVATVLENRALVCFEATLRKIAEKVRDSLDSAQILQRAVTELAIALGISYCDAVVYGPNEQASMIRYQAAIVEEAISQTQLFALANTPALREQLQVHHGSYSFCQLQFPAFAILVCPIFDDQIETVGILGDLWLLKSAHLSFSPMEMDLVQQVASQCAIALRQAKLYQATQEQVEVLKQLNQLKDDFLSTTSHELRTPITQMKMVLHLLKTLVQPNQMEPEPTDPEKSESQATITLPKAKVWQYLNILQEACDRELVLVEDLLNLQTLEAGTFMAQTNTFNLQDVLPQWLEPFEIRTQHQHQHLQIQIAPDLPPLYLDPHVLKRVVSELLTNACKYTPINETIAITVDAMPATIQSTTGSLSSGKAIAATPPTNLCLRITVTNTGIEIIPTALPHLFEKFYRVPNHDPWQQGGTGLGLALIKSLVEQIGGTIRVESGHNQTCFTVCINLSRPRSLN